MELAAPDNHPKGSLTASFTGRLPCARCRSRIARNALKPSSSARLAAVPQLRPSFEDGGPLLEMMEKLDLKGVVSERYDARYRSGRRKE